MPFSSIWKRQHTALKSAPGPQSLILLEREDNYSWAQRLKDCAVSSRLEDEACIVGLLQREKGCSLGTGLKAVLAGPCLTDLLQPSPSGRKQQRLVNPHCDTSSLLREHQAQPACSPRKPGIGPDCLFSPEVLVEEGDNLQKGDSSKVHQSLYSAACWVLLGGRGEIFFSFLYLSGRICDTLHSLTIPERNSILVQWKAICSGFNLNNTRREGQWPHSSLLLLGTLRNFYLFFTSMILESHSFIRIFVSTLLMQ